MNIILPKAGKYNMGDDFPMISIPTDISSLNPEEKTFDDFQWWAQTSEFKKWMDKNKREWQADSEDMSKYGGSITDIIKEHVESYILDNQLNESDVLSFNEFDTINEADENALSEDAKKGIKFHYAYNKLKSEGKLKNITNVDADFPTGAEKAVFISMEDQETKKNIDETLKAFKMIGLQSSSESKVKIISVTESLPGGKLDPDTTMQELVEGMLKTAGEYAAIGVGVGIAWAVLKRVGYGVSAGYVLKKIKGLAPVAKEGEEVVKTTGALAKAGKYVKGLASGGIKKVKVLGSGLVDLAQFKNIRNAAVGTYRGTRAAITGKAGVYAVKSPASKVILKGFSKGATHIAAEAGAKGASRFIPFVGEVLLAIDAIGSTFNWFGTNQAPKWDEIEGTIATGKGGKEFDPGKIADGTSITICWRQPAGTGLGIAASFAWNNDTRTTAELFKIGKGKDGDSIFILTAINSKEYQKALSDHAVTLVSIKNGPINSQSGFSALRRIVDNEDMDVKIAYLDTPDKIASSFNFMGICDWNLLMQYYDQASDQYLITDSNAPETYEYYYQTARKDYVNVSGKLLNNEELGAKSITDIDEIFADSNKKLNNKKPEEKETEKKKEKHVVNPGDNGPPKYDEKKQGATGSSEPKVNDSENNKELWMVPMISEAANSGLVIRKFSEFEDVLEYVNTIGKYPEHMKINESKGDDVLRPTAEEASGPAKLAVYDVTSMQYANPADKQYTPNAFKYFIIGPDDFDAKVGSSIEVGISTDETLIDPRRGVYEYKEEVKKKDEEEGKTSTNPEENPKQNDEESGDDQTKPRKDDYFITADPDDISIKNRKNATVIRDHNFKGGINIVDEFLTDKEKEVLGIPTWKAITLAKTFMNGQGEVIKVKLKNRYAPMFNTVKTYEVRDGEAFQIAKKFAKEVEDRIKFQ